MNSIVAAQELTTEQLLQQRALAIDLLQKPRTPADRENALRKAATADRDLLRASRLSDDDRDFLENELGNLLPALADLCEQTSKWQDAEHLLEEQIQRQSERFGNDAWQTTDARLAMRSLKQRRGFSASQRQQLQSVDAMKVKAWAIYRSGNFTGALTDLKTVAETTGRLLGKEHPKYATSLNNLAVLYVSMGDFTRAESLQLEAKSITEKVLGKEHPEYATNLNNLAGLYEWLGDYGRAEPLHIEAKAIREKVLGKKHPDFALSLNNLAALQYSVGDYARAEPLYAEAKAIFENVLGKEHPDYANSAKDLGVLYLSMGDYAQAEPLLLEANAILAKVLGKEHPDYATSLNDLAGLYMSLGDYARAEPLYMEAKAIEEKVLGKKHPEYANSLNNLALLYDSMGEYVRAEPLYLEAKAIHEKLFGKQHPFYADSLNDLGVLYLSMGDYAQAESLLLEAKAIQNEMLGDEHPRYADSVQNLALLYDSMGEYARADALFVEALKNKTTFTLQMLRAQSEASGLQFLKSNFFGADNVLSVRRQFAEIDAKATYRLSWQSRGLLGSLLRERQMMRGGSPLAAELYEKLGGVSRQLAQLTLANYSPPQQASRRQRLAELNGQKEDLEKKLADASEAFRRGMEIEQVLPADLMEQLTADVAVVDLVETTVWNRSGSGGKWRLTTIREYDAFVLRKSGDGHSVQWLHLGPADAVNLAVQDWLAMIEQSRGEPSSNSHPAAILREKLWEPLEEHLAGATHVIVIPDSATSFIPWAALPGRMPNTYLLEDYTLSTALSGQELYRQLTDPNSEKSDLLLVGGVDYQVRGRVVAPTATEGVRPVMLANRTAAIDLQKQVQWKPLPATIDETETISAMWGNDESIQVLRDADANEDVVQKALPNARYVHLATHGFFADPKFRSAMQYDPKSEQLFGKQGFELVTAGRSTVTGRNPLILSGVVLAGANLPPEKDELGLPSGTDGIMTAQEVIHTDLRGTELVTLSACDTGKGTQVAGGEGIYGLQRAFHLAGARHVVASLWKVDDQATAALMKLFYRNLWQEKQSPATALRNAQLTLLNHPDQIESLATTRGPNFNSTVRVREDATTNPDRTKSKRAPIRLWAAFTHSGPPPAESRH